MLSPATPEKCGASSFWRLGLMFFSLVVLFPLDSGYFVYAVSPTECNQSNGFFMFEDGVKNDEVYKRKKGVAIQKGKAHLSVIVRPSTISNDFSSETIEPIVTKFHR